MAKKIELSSLPETTHPDGVKEYGTTSYETQVVDDKRPRFHKTSKIAA